MATSLPKNLKSRALEIEKNNLIKQLQRLLAQLQNPELTPEQLEQVKVELAEYQKRYHALGF